MQIQLLLEIEWTLIYKPVSSQRNLILKVPTFFYSGIELGIDTLLVLSGVTTPDDLKLFAFKPTLILPFVKDLTI